MFHLIFAPYHSVIIFCTVKSSNMIGEPCPNHHCVEVAVEMPNLAYFSPIELFDSLLNDPTASPTIFLELDQFQAKLITPIVSEANLSSKCTQSLTRIGRSQRSCLKYSTSQKQTFVRPISLVELRDQRCVLIIRNRHARLKKT